jgi:hypothetical protein
MDSPENFVCKECSESFPSERGLHGHFKVHGLSIAEYYIKHFPRKSKLLGVSIPFLNKEEYFERDFVDKKELNQWCKVTKPDIVKKYVTELTLKKIKEKNMQYAPCFVEMELGNYPSPQTYRNLFGSYTNFCKEIGVPLLYGNGLTSNFWAEDASLKKMEIIIDTREQHPLVFPKSKTEKLYVGDYGSYENYCYTFVDRKSEDDFVSTLCKQNIERFTEELEKAKSLGCFIFVVTESTIEQIIYNHKRFKKKGCLNYAFKNMKLLARKYRGTVQFLFSGNRENSQFLIPRILKYGAKLWEVDMQFHVQNWINKQS